MNGYFLVTTDTVADFLELVHEQVDVSLIHRAKNSITDALWFARASEAGFVVYCSPHVPSASMDKEIEDSIYSVNIINATFEHIRN